MALPFNNNLKVPIENLSSSGIWATVYITRPWKFVYLINDYSLKEQLTPLAPNDI
jgi:hypothetical protein